MAALALGAAGGSDPEVHSALALTALSISVVVLVCVGVAAVLYGIDYKKSKEAAPGTPYYNKWYFSYTFRIIVSIGLGLIGVVAGIVMITAVFYLAPRWSAQAKSDKEGRILSAVEAKALQSL